MNFLWNVVRDFIQNFGWAEGMFAIFFFLAHAWIWRLYVGRLNDRQKEIDRLAHDNSEYRKMFLKMVGEKFRFKENQKERK